jgi:hypothetical protein
VDEGMVSSAALSSWVRDRGSITVGLVFGDGGGEQMAKIFFTHNIMKFQLRLSCNHQNIDRSSRRPSDCV